MAAEPRPRRQGFWLTAGEIVGALALVIAGLNLWDSHQQRVEADRRAASQTQAAQVFVARAEVLRGGEALRVTPVSAAQVITAQRYLFPAAVLAEPKEVGAAEPRIEAAWLETGLRHASSKAKGQGRLPVILTTTFVEDGDTHADASLYEVGYHWSPRLLGGPKLRLDGLALVRRGVRGNARSPSFKPSA